MGPSGGSYYDVDPAHRELIHDAFWIWWDRDSNAIPADISAAPLTFTREFKLDGAVKHAILEATAQGAYTLWINDQEVGGGKQWDEMETYDIAPYLKRGVNYIRIEVTSDHWIRGVFVVATVELAGGGRVEILSDSSWEVSSAVAKESRAAEPVVRGINGGPWNNTARLQVMPPQFYGLNTELKVPGIAWGRGYPGEKPKVLAVLARTQQRDLVELVQRMDMDLTLAFTTITHAGTHAPFFPAIDGAREEDVRRRLEEVLQDDYDVVILGLVPGGIFEEVMAERLEEMVRKGTGLVCPSVPGGLREQLTQTPAEGEQAPGFLRTGTPFAQLPGFRLQEGDPEGYQRVASLYKCGEGRVVELRLGGLLADVPDPVELHYEYYISFALRSLLWAAGREPAVELLEMPTTVRAAYGDPASLRFALSGEGTYEVKAALRSPELLSRVPRVPAVRPGVHEFAAVLEPVYETQLSVRAGEEARLELPALTAGDYYVDLMVESRGEKVGWAVVHVAVDGEARIAQLTTDPSYIDVADGKRAELTARATLSKGAPDGSTVRFQVIDNHERVVSEQEARAGADRLAEAK
ncbi:MAG: hypothetical protein QGI33_05750, partial [Candidatus Brocadiia bacterium]|nr:hypothetical protein [Candidatus Brocadiia bacterium]